MHARNPTLPRDGLVRRLVSALHEDVERALRAGSAPAGSDARRSSFSVRSDFFTSAIPCSYGARRLASRGPISCHVKLAWSAKAAPAPELPLRIFWDNARHARRQQARFPPAMPHR